MSDSKSFENRWKPDRKCDKNKLRLERGSVGRGKWGQPKKRSVGRNSNTGFPIDVLEISGREAVLSGGNVDSKKRGVRKKT